MGIPTTSWDPIIIYLIVSKLDVESHKQWENHISSLSDDLPTFLEARFRSLEIIDSEKELVKTNLQPKNKHIKLELFIQLFNKIIRRPISYVLYVARNITFISVNNSDYKRHSKEEILCFNCLQPSHVVSKCRQSMACKRCGRRHHKMLHFEKEGFTENTNNMQQGGSKQEDESTDVTVVEPKIIANFAKRESKWYNVLLATTVLKARSKNMNRIVLRALLDQGSQASFVTEATAQLLGLKRTPVNGFVSGLGDGHMRIKYLVSLSLESCYNPDISIKVNAYTLKNLTSMLPCDKLDSHDWLELKNVQLADPGYATPGKIDILLGAEVYSQILLKGMMKQPKGNFIAQNMAFGWVLSGSMSDSSVGNNNITSLHLQITKENDCLKRFWELEAEPDTIQKKFTVEEQMCEDLYEATTVRNDEGRYIVTLPFKDEYPNCQYGDSKKIAMKKLFAIERRLMNDTKLYEEYRKVLKEYLTLGHMSLVEEDYLDYPKVVYLPHHAVVREDKETTKVRVIFNASSKGVNGVSLNDDLMVGTKIQQDLRHILMRWRTYPICIVADLVKCIGKF